MSSAVTGLSSYSIGSSHHQKVRKVKFEEISGTKTLSDDDELIFGKVKRLQIGGFLHHNITCIHNEVVIRCQRAIRYNSMSSKRRH